MTVRWYEPTDDVDDQPGRGMRLSLRHGPADYFVRVPIVVMRQLVAELSGAEFKLLCFFVDRIYSYPARQRSHSDLLSYRQMQHGITARDGRLITRGTGLSRNSIARALKSLEERGLIMRLHRLRESGATAITELQLILPTDEAAPEEA